MGELDFRKKRKNTNIRGTARKQGKNSRQRELRFENEKREKRSSGKRWGKNKKNTKGIVLWAVELLLVCMTAVFLVAAFGQRVNVIGDSMSPVLKNGNVVIRPAKEFHEYTVSFLAYIMWDPVHMYNAVVNDWKDVEPQITFDVRQPKTRAHSLERLRRFLDTHQYVDVVRFTTFFHQFTLIFDELAREKYVDWFGYYASVSPYILEQFEKEVAMRSVRNTLSTRAT